LSAVPRYTYCGRPAWSDPLVRSTLPAADAAGPSATQCLPDRALPAPWRSPTWRVPRLLLIVPQPNARDRGACARSRCTPPRWRLVHL